MEATHSAGDQVERLAQTESQQPVYLLFSDAKTGESLALDLRHYGFKARNFVSTAVLRNAAASAAPAAIIADAAVLDDDGASTEAFGDGVPLIFVSHRDDLDIRLRAVRAGGSGFFRLPLNRTALLHRLYQIMAPAPDHPTQVVLYGGVSSRLEDAPQALRDMGVDLTICGAPGELLPLLTEKRTDLLLINGDDEHQDPLELVRALRQMDSYQGLPIVLLTSASKRSLDEAAATAGVDTLVGLPVDGKDLAAIVATRSRRAASLREAYRYLAKRDATTGLYNADYFLDSLRHTLASRRSGALPAALALIELTADRAADPLLIHAADLLRRMLPAASVAARVGASEFGLLIYGLDAGALEQLAEELEERLADLNLQIGDVALTGSARVGLTILGTAEATPADALLRARQALRLSSPELHAAAESSRADHALVEHWAERAREALDSHRFRLVYQPIASLSGHPTAFYEVFLRMLDEDGEDILPREFLPAAAQAGLGTDLDRWVISRAIDVLASQKDRQHRPVLFIKLFPETVGNPGACAWIADQLRAHHLAPDQLVFEITERTATTRLSETAQLIKGLQGLGCQIALEHVSDRPHSVEALRTLKPQYIKLAAELTDEAASDVQRQKRIQALTGQARSAGARPVAALVQDASNLSVLWRCGVEYIQGYFMQEPADVFEQETAADG